MLAHIRYSILALAILAPSYDAEAKTIKFKSDTSWSKWSSKIKGTLRFPKGEGPFPVVVFLHTCGGNRKSILIKSQRGHSNFLLKNGFATFIIDSYGPRKIRTVCKVRNMVRASIGFQGDDALNAAKMLGKMKKIDRDHIFLIGQSLGASASLKIALGYKKKFRGIAAYYPGCNALAEDHDTRVPLIIFAAGRDDWTPPQKCIDAKKYRDPNIGSEFSIIVYPDAHHGFDQRRKDVFRIKGHTLKYNRAATADSRLKMLEFFRRQMK